MLKLHLEPHCERWPSYTLAAPNHFLSLFDFNKETYTRVLWWKVGDKISKSKLKTHCLLGFKHLKSSTPTKQRGDWYDFKLKSKVKHTISGETRSSTDCFFTPNEFFVWQKTSNLASLHANWLDIDIEPPQYSGRETTRQAVALRFERVLSEVKSLLLAANIPPPSGYVSSGSGGVHLYWIYDPVNAYRKTVKVWRMIADALCEPLTNQSNRIWEVDSNASNRPGGLLRLPGTLHSETSCQVLGYTGGGLYQFEQLAASLGIKVTKLEPANKVHSKSCQPRTLMSGSIQRISQGKHTIGQWWFKIYSNICSHFRRLGHVPKGKRNYFLLICYVALQHMCKSKEEAYERLKTLNSDLVGWSESELASSMKTASETHYKFRKETVAKYLENCLKMDTDFLFQPSSIPLTKAEIQRRQSKAGKQTAIARRKGTLDKLSRHYGSLIQNNEKVTQEVLAQRVGCSVRTVRRYWQELLSSPQLPQARFTQANVTEDNRCPSIYPPSLKLSASRKEIQINYSLEPVELSELGRKCCQRLWTNLVGGLSVPKLSISLVNTEGCYAVNSQIHRL